MKCRTCRHYTRDTGLCHLPEVQGLSPHLLYHGPEDYCECWEALPTVAELTGCDPNFTGDLTTQEYINELRGKP